MFELIMFFVSMLILYALASFIYTLSYDTRVEILRKNLKVGDRVKFLYFAGGMGILRETTIMEIRNSRVLVEQNKWVHRNSIYPLKEKTLEGYLFSLFRKPPFD